MCSYVIYTKMIQFSISLSVVWVVMDREFQLVLTGFIQLHLSVVSFNLWTFIMHTFLFHLMPAIYSACLVVPREVQRLQLWKPVKIQWGNLIPKAPNTNCSLLGIVAFMWFFLFLRRQVPTPSRPSRSLGNSLTRVVRRG
jgi:hypothetical protein